MAVKLLRARRRKVSGWITLRRGVQYAALLIFIVLFVEARNGGWPGETANIFIRTTAPPRGPRNNPGCRPLQRAFRTGVARREPPEAARRQDCPPHKAPVAAKSSGLRGAGFSLPCRRSCRHDCRHNKLKAHSHGVVKRGPRHKPRRQRHEDTGFNLPF